MVARATGRDGGPSATVGGDCAGHGRTRAEGSARVRTARIQYEIVPESHHVDPPEAMTAKFVPPPEPVACLKRPDPPTTVQGMLSTVLVTKSGHGSIWNDRCRDELGADRLAALVERGAAMTHDQLLDLVEGH